MAHNRGMDWIRLHKRMAIYARDDFDCVWCRLVFPTPELGYGLQLDHLEDPHDHRPVNLVTSCQSGNSSRQDTPLEQWLRQLDGGAWARVAERLRRPLDLDLGLRLARARRPSYTRS